MEVKMTGLHMMTNPFNEEMMSPCQMLQVTMTTEMKNDMTFLQI